MSTVSQAENSILSGAVQETSGAQTPKKRQTMEKPSENQN